DHPGGPSKEERQHAARERIERAAVADPPRGADAADERHHVVRCRPGWLGQDEDPLEARPGSWSATSTVARHRDAAGDRVAQRATSAARRRASTRTASRASTRGSGTVAPAARACPPPPNRPVRTVASTPPGRVRTLIRVALPCSLKTMATSAPS